MVVTLNARPSDDAMGKLMMARKGFTFTNLTAPDDSWATRNYQFMAAPTTVLLDSDGKAMLRHLGYSLDWLRAMDQAIAYLLDHVKGKN